MYYKLLALFAFAGMAASCSDGPTHPTGCSGDIQVSVDTHRFGPTRPVFSWTPRCGTTFLTVTTVQFGIGDPAVIWTLSVPDNLSMAPPIVYGSTPPGANTYTPAQPLVLGQTYRVDIGTTVGGDVLSAQGNAMFTP